jgi:hypothetical protein
MAIVPDMISRPRTVAMRPWRISLATCARIAGSWMLNRYHLARSLESSLDTMVSGGLVRSRTVEMSVP